MASAGPLWPRMQYDPDTLAQRYARRNRVALWRGRLPELIFLLAVSLLALAALLYGAGPYWPALLGEGARWNTPRNGILAAVLCCAAMWMALRQRWQRHRAQQQTDWLAALPIAPDTRHRHAVRHAHLHLLIHAAAGVLALLWIAWRAPGTIAPFWLGLLVALLVAALCAPLAVPRTAGASTISVSAASAERRARTRIPAKASGLKLLGHALEPLAARLPRSAWAVGLGCLMVPVGSGLWTIVGLVGGFSALGLARDLVSDWRSRFLADQAWLAALPLSAPRLFAAYLPTLASRAAMLGLLLAAALHALSVPRAYAGLGAFVLITAIGHGILTGYATRRRPRAFALWMALHYVGLFGCLQVLPPALPIVLAALLLWLWRRGST